ncbi:uncharacterized protein LOC111694880 [Eurytemora carolleeae]|uniref:uncharacterized protein LOC111694880 n=1 Tax=Eurytemora carolleeae TaxID=1294199 RepID=UPI000C75F99C|nr:uncharacterized protein LOC111694880 [Eurytemora carolleeae]|eukprot:XP_023319701.1 uncharacterized protein LOC111694880 [Eurytemora affinis]
MLMLECIFIIVEYVFLFLEISLSLVSLVLGVKGLEDCPSNPNVPKFLILAGLMIWTEFLIMAVHLFFSVLTLKCSPGLSNFSLKFGIILCIIYSVGVNVVGTAYSYKLLVGRNYAAIEKMSGCSEDLRVGGAVLTFLHWIVTISTLILWLNILTYDRIYKIRNDIKFFFTGNEDRVTGIWNENDSFQNLHATIDLEENTISSSAGFCRPNSLLRSRGIELVQLES